MFSKPGGDDGGMNSLEKELIWNGYEDYTGLWDAFLTVRDSPPAAYSAQEARNEARRLLESFLARGWVELYVSHGPAGETQYEIVPAEERAGILDSETSWTWEDGDPLVWYATTDEGMFAYQEATTLLS